MEAAAPEPAAAPAPAAPPPVEAAPLPLPIVIERGCVACEAPLAMLTKGCLVGMCAGVYVAAYGGDRDAVRAALLGGLVGYVLVKNL